MLDKKTNKLSMNWLKSSKPANKKSKSADYNSRNKNNAMPNKLDSSPNNTLKKWNKSSNPTPF